MVIDTGTALVHPCVPRLCLLQKQVVQIDTSYLERLGPATLCHLRYLLLLLSTPILRLGSISAHHIAGTKYLAVMTGMSEHSQASAHPVLLAMPSLRLLYRCW